jgi:hypothetical protein
MLKRQVLQIYKNEYKYYFIQCYIYCEFSYDDFFEVGVLLVRYHLSSHWECLRNTKHEVQNLLHGP